MSQLDHETIERQPFLPRVSLIWFFVVMTMAAIALFIIRAAEQGQALAAAITFTSLFAVLLCLLSGMCFTIAFFMGAMERAVAAKSERPASPFIDGRMPEQIIPPNTVDER